MARSPPNSRVRRLPSLQIVLRNSYLWMLQSINRKPNALYICNPITGEYIELPNDGLIVCSLSTSETYGFGVSKMTGQYKVVRIVHECIREPDTYEVLGIKNCICHVFTLGTGKWRSIAPCAPFADKPYSIGAFINGSLHWLVTDFQGSYLISCFDLETEIFSTFYPPPLPLPGGESWFGWWLVVLGDYLFVCDSASADEIVIWLMKKYGDERSWTKEFVIKKAPQFVRGNRQYLGNVSPIRVFKDGEILIAWYGSYMFYYSNKNKTTQKIDMLGVYEHGCGFQAMLHTSSFLSPKSCFPMENVRPF